MELVEGETLEKLIERSGRLEAKAGAGNCHAGRCRVGGSAQAEARSSGHQTNIMVSVEEGGTVTAKIIDLGLAKSVNEPGSKTTAARCSLSTFCQQHL